MREKNEESTFFLRFIWGGGGGGGVGKTLECDLTQVMLGSKNNVLGIQQGNDLCTECTCAVGYSGATCENCALENCFGCTGVPAVVCDACDTGYVINTLGICGKPISDVQCLFTG